MVIKTEDIFIWIPRDITPKFKVEIVRRDGSTDDVTSRVESSEFADVATIGIGDCRIKLNNTDSFLSGRYVGGETVKFYLDFSAGTTLRWKGRLDYPKDSLTGTGHFLDIEGRHTSFQVTETFVNKSYSDATATNVMNDLIDTYLVPLGFTRNNVETINTTVTFAWSDKSVWNCFQDICTAVGADVYIDDDKDVHFFAENSKMNDEEAAVEGQNMLGLIGFGKDTYKERSRIIITGQSENGIPVIFTKTDGTVAGTDIREIQITDLNISTMEEAEKRADAELQLRKAANLVEQISSVRCLPLPALVQGDNFWISAPRQRIHGIYKALEVRHFFGRSGIWTDVKVEKETEGVGEIVRDRIRKENALTKGSNPNDMRFSYNFEFDNTNNLESLTNMHVSEGKLQLVDTSSMGTFTTSTRVHDSNILRCEIREFGDSLNGFSIRVSNDGGTTYFPVSVGQLLTFLTTGNRLKITGTVTHSSTNPNPALDSFAALYSDS